MKLLATMQALLSRTPRPAAARPVTDRSARAGEGLAGGLSPEAFETHLEWVMAGSKQLLPNRLILIKATGIAEAFGERWASAKERAETIGQQTLERHLSLPEDEEGHGTSVLLYLPRVEREGADETSAAPARTAQTPLHGNGRILVVDDNADMRAASVSILRSLGYSVIEAGDAHEAIQAMDSDLPFDLVFSDIVMPGDLTGVDLARIARIRGVRILLTSGFANPVEIHAEARSQGFEVLAKPYRKADLATRVRSLLQTEPKAGT
ncbi:MAG: response regulator [Rhodospirillaceae bacterium]|nr:response regulator [Rhodospirillaceae bacterium]